MSLSLFIYDLKTTARLLSNPLAREKQDGSRK